MDTRERVAQELGRWQKQIEKNEPRNGPHAEASAIMRVFDEERAELVKALEIMSMGSASAALYTLGINGWHERTCGWVTHETDKCNCRLGDRLAALGERR